VDEPGDVPSQVSPTSMPFDGRPHRLTLGLRRLDLAYWLEVDEHRDAELAEKARLLRERPEDVVAHVPGGLAGAAECLTLVQQWLEEHRPDLPRTADPRLHPVDAAGRLVQEDLCVLVRQQAGWVLAAASVCFPSRWLLAQKIGRPMDAIHAPVPHYDQIADAVDAATDRLTPARPMWRLNWTLLSDPALFQLPERRGPQPYPGLDGMVLRVERQTLRRLPRSDAVLFTIRTHRTPLGAALRAPGAAEALAATLQTVDEAHAQYKGWAGWLGPMLTELGCGDTPATGQPTADGRAADYGRSATERARP
jgi:hypothetical protein